MSPNDFLIAKGFVNMGYSKPYTYYSSNSKAIGICIPCGIIITGDALHKEKDGQLTIPKGTKNRWHSRRIDELERIIQ